MCFGVGLSASYQCLFAFIEILTMPNLNFFLEKINQSTLSSEAKNLMQLFIGFITELESEKEAENRVLKEEVRILTNRVQTMENKQDTANQYSRQDSIIISPKKNSSGTFLPDTIPNYTNSENTKTLVRQLFKDHLRLELQDNDISVTHRLQPVKKPRSSSEPSHDRRNIVIRFCRKDLVGTVFRHCKEQNPPFFVNESLTPVRNSICYALRMLKKKHYQIAKVRTFKGIPRVFLSATRTTRNRTASSTSARDQNLTRIDISSVLELEDFVKNKLNTTLQEEAITIKNRV